MDKGFYKLIRYAYGADLSCYLWAGQICFDLYRASEPFKALMVFYDILESMMSPEGFDSITDFDIETAQSSIAYRRASNGATPGSVISTSLRSSLEGYSSLQEYTDFVQGIIIITRSL